MRKLVIVLALLCLFSLYGRSHETINNPAFAVKAGDPYMFKIHNVGNVWNTETNYGGFGDPASIYPSYDWPGAYGYYYLWEGRLWIGSWVNGQAYVSHCDYGAWEFEPDVNSWSYEGPGISQYDLVSNFHDWGSRNPGRALGLHITQKSYQWSVKPYDNFIMYCYEIVWIPESSDVVQDKDELTLYVAFVFDADVCEADAISPHIDDLVCFDGYTAGEWVDMSYWPAPSDNYTILADSTIDVPDGVPDQYQIWGDDVDEHTKDGQIYYIPRNMSFIYDGDDPAEPGDDTGEYGACPGYIFGRIIYAPPSPADSFFVDANGDSARIVRAYAHGWWNWNNDPGSDEDKLRFMDATNPAMKGFRFMPHVFDMQADEFDYRFLLSTGPFTVTPYETLEIVYAAGVGYGLNGGVDNVYNMGKVPGARQIADYAMTAYYMGSQGDPAHPTSPNEDDHFIVPVPPEVPDLYYSAVGDRIILTWSNIAEITPDPMDGEYDFAGYRIYRSEWNTANWVLLAEYDSSYAPDYPHSFVDSNVVVGVPYYYAVTAYDKGRPADTITGKPAIPSLETGKTNYLQDETGPVPIYVKFPATSMLDSVRVVPNPYYGSARWEPEYENVLRFIGLPDNCRIKIYTMSGDLVKEIIHYGPTGEETWNLRSRSDIEISSGLYFYKIERYDADGNYLESKVGKFLVIR